MSVDDKSLRRAIKVLAEAGESLLDRHPDPAELAAYRRGELPPTEADGLQEHLALCRDCTALVMDLEALASDEHPLPREHLDAAWQAMRVQLADDFARPATSAGARRVARPEPTPAWRSRQEEWWRAPVFAWSLAASFLLATCFSGWWALRLQNKIATLSQPQWNVVIHDLDPAGFERAEERSQQKAAEQIVTIPSHVIRFVLILNPRGNSSHSEYYGRIFAPTGREVGAAQPLAKTRYGNFTIELTRHSLPAGLYRIEIYTVEGSREVLLDHYRIRIDYR